MARLNIARQRLANQRIANSTFDHPSDAVKWFGAVQAQDYTCTAPSAAQVQVSRRTMGGRTAYARRN
jgi:hypothetical protein